MYASVGDMEGTPTAGDGAMIKADVGADVVGPAKVGLMVGGNEGPVGLLVGDRVGLTVGAEEGLEVGLNVGDTVGVRVGTGVGLVLGL